jgi:hypothetical protein
MKNYLLVGSLLFLSACAAVKPPEVATSQSSRFFEKSYALDIESTTYVGNPIVKLKDYYLIKTETPALTPSSTFHVNFGRLQAVFLEKTDYPILGYVEIDGKQYSLIEVPQTNSLFNIAVDSSGVPSTNAYNKNLVGAFQRSLVDARFSEPSPHMDRSVRTKIDATKGYANHELLYNGTDGKSILVTYREFSPDDLARTAFYQNLTYEAKNEIIRFKNYRIKIMSATSESIKFTVIEDGISSK